MYLLPYPTIPFTSQSALKRGGCSSKPQQPKHNDACACNDDTYNCQDYNNNYDNNDDYNYDDNIIDHEDLIVAYIIPGKEEILNQDKIESGNPDVDNLI